MTQIRSTTCVAIVTGAAGGMGVPCAKRLAAEGWPLLLCDLDRARLEQVAFISGCDLKVDGGMLAALGF